METAVRELRHLARMGTRLVRRTGDGPELLVQFVSSRCDCRCAHCFDWRRRGSAVEAQDLTTAELTRLARALPPLYFLILTGGEPFLRPDLGDVVATFAREVRPRVLAIPTNGGQPDVVLDTVARVLPTLPPAVTLSLNVSLDGVGALHDELRERPGQFAAASETLRGLVALSRRDPRLSVGVVTVLSARNQDHVEDVMRYALDELQVPVWAPFLVRGDPRDPAVGQVDLARYVAVSEAMERRIRRRAYAGYRGFLGARLNTAKNVVRRTVIERTVREKRRIVPCTAGRHAAVVYADGTVQPCELLDAPMGNLRDFDFDWRALWRSQAAAAARRAVDAGRCACTHENILTTSVAYATRQWARILRWSLWLSRSS